MLHLPQHAVTLQPPFFGQHSALASGMLVGSVFTDALTSSQIQPHVATQACLQLGHTLPSLDARLALPSLRRSTLHAASRDSRAGPIAVRRRVHTLRALRRAVPGPRRPRGCRSVCHRHRGGGSHGRAGDGQALRLRGASGCVERGSSPKRNLNLNLAINWCDTMHCDDAPL